MHWGLNSSSVATSSKLLMSASHSTHGTPAWSKMHLCQKLEVPFDPFWSAFLSGSIVLHKSTYARKLLERANSDASLYKTSFKTWNPLQCGEEFEPLPSSAASIAIVPASSVEHHAVAPGE